MNLTQVVPCGNSAPPNTSPWIAGASNAGVSQFAYLDLSNIWVPGAQVSAARLGLAPSAQAAAEQQICDPAFRLNLHCLRRFVVGNGASNTRSVCVGSTKVADDFRIANAARHAGWVTHMLARAKSGREKCIETSLTVFMLEDLPPAGMHAAAAEVTLLSGDRDLLPAVEALVRRGYAVDVVAWRHAASGSLVGVARKFIALDDYFDLLTFRQQGH